MAFIVPQVSNAKGFEIETKLYCDATKTIVDSLKKEFKEMPFAFGNTSDQAKTVMSLWVNPVSKSWTILATKDDLTCVVGVGNNFELVPYKSSVRI